MPRVTIIQTNFTAGEVSPKCYGRVDVARYQNGAQYMPNCVVNLHGGAERRPGLVFVAPTKFTDRRARLIPFIFNIEQAYVLELGHLYMRVYVQGGGQVLVGSDAYEVATPYTEEMLAALDYTQGADTMFLFHQRIAINTLKRLAVDLWSMQAAPITVAPFDEIGHTFNSAATLSSAAVGSRVLTTPDNVFLTGDVGRRISYLSGLAVITSVESAVSITVNVLAGFPSTVLAANAWVLEDSPQSTITPGNQGPIGINTELSASTASWRPEDVGKYVRINNGLCLIVSFSSSTSVMATIKEALTSVVASPPSAWTLEAAVWNALDGYPATGAFYEQRLAVAGSPAYPQTVWGSRSGLFYDYTIGLNDDDAFSFSLPSTGQINPIRRMASMAALMPMTYGGEYTMEGGNDSPLTPTNVKAKAPSVYGCNTVKPVRIGDEVLFVQRAGRKVRSMAYRIESDTYKAPDLTVLAEHITESGITEMAYQQEPRSTLWCVRADGKMAVMTLDRDEGVIAWTPQETNGEFESVASIPNATGDEVWVIVRRTVDGQQVRYVERFDATLYTDSTVIGTDSDGATVWTGLDHLEGTKVQVRGDGTFVGEFTVAGGTITIPEPKERVEIGMGFTNSVTLLRPEVQAGDGTAQNNAQRTHEVAMLLADTIGAKVNGSVVAFRQFGASLLDVPPQDFSGFKRVGLTGWSRGEDTITITQEEPYPFHLLSVVRKYTVNS